MDRRRIQAMLALLLASAVLGVAVVDAEGSSAETPAPAPVPREYDCPLRQLAIDFAHEIQPRLTFAQLQELVDAVDGAQEAQNCTSTVPGTAPLGDSADGRRLLSRRHVAPGTTSFYVDAAKGSDSNSGSASSPFQTIERGVTACRGVSGSCSVVLREGTFYLTSPLMLTKEDSGLTIMNAPGDDVWLSGGTVLSPEFKPYNVTPGGTVTVFSSPMNCVSNTGPGTPGVIWGAKTATSDACEAMCVANTSCTAFTWHDSHQGKFANDCVFRTDGELPCVPQSGHTSGYKNAPRNVYRADLSAAGISSVPGLRINGKRQIRARYPNAIPWLDGFGSTLNAKSWSPPDLPHNPDKQVEPDQPFRGSGTSFQKYQLGIGGPCRGFTPPAGYWCGNGTAGGGGVTYRIPTGMTADKTILPNSPYKDPVTTPAVIQAWRPAHWASWMFEVGKYDADTGLFTFSKGGFQGARGDNNGEHFYIENVFEELDFPGEFFFDESERALYLYYNGTGAPPPSLQVIATNLKVLVDVTGTMADPVKDITLSGLGFRDTAQTYLDPHGMPSGGDWGLQRTAAVQTAGTEGFTVSECTFWNLDGNALLLSNYTRSASIVDNEFAWIGDTAIASWGNAEGSGIPGMGWDGTNGDQPRGTVINRNYVHEIGIWEKQSSFYTQAKTCQAHIEANVFVNGPRAGINFNDGFGGGANITRNFATNQCRESGDHGPFNSWDRQPYLWNGTVQKDWDHISHNFFIANYNSQEAVDNDDGSQYYDTHDNFFSYSGRGMKSDFSGHDQNVHGNVYGYIGLAFHICEQLPGHEDRFYNNSVVITIDGGDYGQGQTCHGSSTEGKTFLANNSIYTPSGSVSECGMPLSKWQAQGNDPGTTVAAWPSPAEILEWGKAKIGMQ